MTTNSNSVIYVTRGADPSGHRSWTSEPFSKFETMSMNNWQHQDAPLSYHQEMDAHGNSVYSAPSDQQYGPPQGNYSQSYGGGGGYGHQPPHYHQAFHSHHQQSFYQYPTRSYGHQQRSPPLYNSTSGPNYSAYVPPPPQQYHHQPQLQPRMSGPPVYDNMSYHHQPQSYPYQYPPASHRSAFYRPPHQGPPSRSSSITPGSNMSSITIDYPPPGLQFPRHHTPAPFDSRTPSPDIPIPPSFFRTSHTNHSKLLNPTATKVEDVASADGPLRETCRLNVKDSTEEPDSLTSGQDYKALDTTEPPGDDSEGPSQTIVIMKKSAIKPAVSDATLLLGLRTLSPAGTCATHDSLSLDLHDDHNTISTVASTVDSAFHKPPGKGTPQTPARALPAIPKNYPRRLALDGDEFQLNALHCFIRRVLLEVFVVEPKKHVTEVTASTNSSAGRVGFRCTFCAMARRTDPNGRNEAPMAVFYPRALAEIYRLVTSYQRCHLRKCRNLPPAIRAEWDAMRETEKTRGKTSYWVDSAKDIGLVDCVSKAGGIRFSLPCDSRDVGMLEMCNL